MTYAEGLGQFNIAVDRTAQIRALQYQLQQRQAAPVAPTTAVLIRPTTTTFAPKPTPVLTIKPTTTVAPKPIAPTPVIRPTLSVASKPTATTATMKPAGAGAIITSRADTLLSSFSKSPLPLIAIGIGALLLFNRKGR